MGDYCAAVLTEAAVLPFRSAGRQLADGDWLVELADDTYERIQEHRLPGETN